MGAREEEIWRQGVALRDAWLTYADHVWPDGNRAARLRALWRGKAEDSLEDTNHRLGHKLINGIPFLAEA